MKKLLAVALAVAMVVVAMPMTAAAVTSDRVNEDGYIEIRTIEDLYSIRYDLTANYILMNDIDLTEATAKGGDWDYMGNGWNPIASDDRYAKDSSFAGVLDGNGHKIIGMRISVGSGISGAGSFLYCGLFSSITGAVYNLTIENASISGYTSSSTASSICAGVLAGYASGNITGVSVSGKTTLEATEGYTVYSGGLVGRVAQVAIRNCSSNVTMDISADDYAPFCGGITAIAEGATIDSSFSTGDITAYSAGSALFASGIVNLSTSTKEDTIISNCYNTGAIDTSTGYQNHYARYVGGIAFAWAGKHIEIHSCYNTGETSGSQPSAVSNATAVDSYYLSGSGYSSAGAAALTDTQMKIQAMYKGFDFENIWTINPFANYPYAQLKDNIQDMGESAEYVSILSLPAKTEYFTGDTLDFTGAMLKVVYVSGREEIIDITDNMVSGFDMEVAGKQTVTVTVAGASDTYTINVTKRPVVSAVSIILEPNVKVFAVGTAFDFTGAKAKISYVGGVTEYKDITAEATTGGNIHHVGKQTITYEFGGKSATFEVEVIGVSLDKIVLTKLPDKLSYMEGHPLELSGMVVTAVMNNGMENTVGEGYTVSGYSAEPGTHTITVTYLGKTASFEVSVAAKNLVSLAMNALPDKLEYISGQPFDESGMQVLALYDNGDVVVTEDYTLSGYDNVPGIKNVIISLGNQSVSFPVRVVARTITDFRLVSIPTKLEYIEYDAFDSTGLKAEVTYNDGLTEVVTGYTVVGFSSKPGTHTLSVAYEGFVKSFEITVLPRVLVDVKVTAPDKVAYYLGEVFDSTGMIVTACYNNGQEIAVDEYQVTGFESAAPGPKTVTVTYGGISRSFAVAVQERSVIETGGNMIVGGVIGRKGDTTVVPVNVTKNTGIAGFTHTIRFDATDLKFVSVTAVGDYANGMVIVNDKNATNGEVTVLWFGNTDVKGDGVVYNIAFEVLETAQDGNSEITISFDDNDNGNISGENVIFGTMNGFVEVRSYWLGDLNGDRTYTMVDVVQLAQYVSGQDMTLTDKQALSADVNEDGTIDIHDVILLNQWLLSADM